jgi:hypothetical protein
MEWTVEFGCAVEVEKTDAVFLREWLILEGSDSTLVDGFCNLGGHDENNLRRSMFLIKETHVYMSALSS